MPTMFERLRILHLDEYDNVLGIDFGHGETSAAVIKLDDDGTRVKDLKFDSNVKYKIITALFLYNDGRVVIGEDAIDCDPREGQLFTCFKTKPRGLEDYYDNTNIKKNVLVQKFFKAVVDQLFYYNENDLQGRTVIFVGCPSDPDEWLAYDAQYAQILASDICTQEDNEPIPVVIMPESRASFIKVFKEKRSNKLDKGTMLADIGSSTSDITYINDKCTLSDEFSEPLGASYIENIMLEMLLGEEYEVENLMNEQRERINLRLSKESHYNRPQNDISFILHFKSARKGSSKVVKIIDQEFMEEVAKGASIRYTTRRMTKTGTWYDLCTRFFENAKARIGSKPLETIILTGGASRMDFVQEICRKVFPGKNILIDKDPSYCVSRGLAWAGYTDIKAIDLLQQTQESVKSRITDAFPRLESYIANDLAASAFSLTESMMRKWKDEGDTVSLQTEINAIQKEFQTYLSDENTINKFLKEKLDMWLNEGSGVASIIANTVNEKFAQEYPNSIKEVGKFAVDHEKWGKVVQSLLVDKKIQLNIDNIQNYFSLDGGFMIAFKLLISILILPLAILDGILDTDLSDAAIDRLWNINKNRTFRLDKRIKMYNQLLEKRDTIVSDMATGIQKSAFTQDQKQSIVETIYNNVEGDINNAVNMISMHFTKK